MGRGRRNRRPAGGGGGSGGTGGSGAAVLLPPLPASAIEYWHSELACTPTAWIGQIGARSLTGIGTPVVATDPGFFNGKVVAQSAITGSKTWLGTFAALAVIGSRPWLFCVARARTFDAAGRTFAATNGVNSLRFVTANFRGLWNSAGSINSAGGADTNPHRLSTWLDGASISLRLDGAITSAAFGAAITADMTTVAVGQDTAGGGLADASVAFYLICSTKPTAPEEAALDAWSLAYWGV